MQDETRPHNDSPRSTVDTRLVDYWRAKIGDAPELEPDQIATIASLVRRIDERRKAA